MARPQPRAGILVAGLRFLLDTNVLSERARPYPNAGIQSRLQAHRDEVCTAAPVLHEMHYGLVRMPDGARKQELIRYANEVLHPTLAILPYDREAALRHAEERARLTSRGRTPPFVDGQIAAIAMVNDLILVTRNTRNFEDFIDLRWENWFT